MSNSLPQPQPEKMESCDVVVIGGGPAGSAAASRLARSGLHVIQLERRQYFVPTNDRIRSGEGLLPRTVTELRAVGIEIEKASWAWQRIRRLLIRWPTGATSEDRFPGTRSIILIDREGLDAALFHAARDSGVDAREGWQVRCITQNGAGIFDGVLAAAPDGGIVRVRSRLVIDAGGRNARSITQLNLRQPVSGTQFIVVALFMDGLAGLEPDRWEMRFFGGAPLAILQITHLTSGLVRCAMGINLHVRRRQTLPPEAFFWDTIKQEPALEQRLRAGHQMRPPYARAELAYRARQLAFPGLLIIGDAAGYLNPILGDGIWSALRSAAIASEVARAAFRANDTSLRQLKHYERRWTTQRNIRWLIARSLLFGYDHPSCLRVPASIAPLRRAMLRALLHD